jgi:hypothetical protein
LFWSRRRLGDGLCDRVWRTSKSGEGERQVHQDAEGCGFAGGLMLRQTAARSRRDFHQSINPFRLVRRANCRSVHEQDAALSSEQGYCSVQSFYKHRRLDVGGDPVDGCCDTLRFTYRTYL